ncbi:MAG: peptide deformylase [Myxococcales bacterium]|nr:peptide deformylase [Myxococcales bacterium]
MTTRALRIFPDPVLRERCREIDCFDENLSRLVDDLAESMYAHRGVGLAAPQIGESLRVMVVDVDQREGAPRLLEFVNPRISAADEELEEREEGCLSFPGEAEMVRRPRRVTVQALDRRGQPFEITAEGLLATAMQHEIDHLDGKLFIDYLSRLRRSLVTRRMKKRSREGE